MDVKTGIIRIILVIGFLFFALYGNSTDGIVGIIIASFFYLAIVFGIKWIIAGFKKEK